MKKAEIILKNAEGLHARPASIFAKTAGSFECDLVLFKNGDKNKEYNPKSIISIMSMGAAQDDKITIIAEGQDEVEAVDSLCSLVENDFQVSN